MMSTVPSVDAPSWITNSMFRYDWLRTLSMLRRMVEAPFLQNEMIETRGCSVTVAGSEITGNPCGRTRYSPTTRGGDALCPALCTDGT